MLQRNSRMITGILSLLLVTSLFLTGCNADKDQEANQEQESAPTFEPLDTSAKKVIAKSEGMNITEGELNQYLNILAFLDYQVSMMLSDSSMKEQMNEFKRIILKGYAAEKQIAQEVKKEAEYKKKAQAEMKTLEESLKNPQAPMPEGEEAPKSLDEAIKDKGFTKAQLEAFIVRSLQRNDYFDAQMKEMKYDKVTANHILVALEADPEGKEKRTDAEAKKRAEEVKKKLDEGGDFKKLAAEYSDDTGSKEAAGLVEGSADQFVPAFSKAVKTLPLNKISDPIKTEYGYHVVKVTKRSKESLAKASDEIKQQKAQELNQKYIDEELKIDILLPESEQTKK